MHAQLEAKASEERADLQAQHNRAKGEWEQMLTRRAADSKMFTYVVRGAEGAGSGSVPRQIFDAEPSSALSKLYNGEWEYAADAQGRAMVNSNPMHWPIILDWLSFGTVPSNPTPELISECRFWQLERLLTIIAAQPANQDNHSPPEAQEESHRFNVVSSPGNIFVYGHISNCQQRLHSVFKSKKEERLEFEALDRDWCLELAPRGMYLRMLRGEPLKWRQVFFVCGTCEGRYTTPIHKSFGSGGRFQQEKGYGWTYEHGDTALLLHPALAYADKSVPIVFGMQAGSFTRPSCVTM